MAAVPVTAVTARSRPGEGSWSAPSGSWTIEGVSEPVHETVEAVRIPHTRLEDVLGLALGVVVASLGLYLIECAGAVTGGTAGVSLLLTYGTGLPFGVLFILVNLPFFGLALWKKGWVFTAKSLGTVVVASLLSGLHARVLDLGAIDELYGVVVGNFLTGLGLLALFRHGASLGGFGILAVWLQETVGWRAGYVQMGLDVVVVLCALLVVSPATVLLSALGAIILNIVLAFNHRPGRYIA